jgi:hypothetical protein
VFRKKYDKKKYFEAEVTGQHGFGNGDFGLWILDCGMPIMYSKQSAIPIPQSN